jgi:two-component system sensor histidine kinase VicK
VHITVEDRGGGVLPEDEARVFTRRYQAENPLIPGLGDTGVGLSIAKTLAEAHNGRLWLESHQGVGSTLHAVLPLNDEMRS